MSMNPAMESPFRLTSQIAESERAGAAVRAGGLDEAAARAAAEEFEAHFLATFAESMFSNVKTDGPFGGGQGEAAFRSLLSQEYGKDMAANGGVGIADSVFAEILRIQEASQ